MTGAGRLDRKIEIQSQPSGDVFSVTQDWSTVFSCFARVEPLQGSELFQAQQINSKLTTKITIRYRSGINASQRVVYGDRYFNVVSIVDKDMRHRELILMCEEVV